MLHPTHLQVNNLFGQLDDFLSAVHIDGDGHFELFIESHCGRTVQDDVDVLHDGLPLVGTDSQSRQRAVATDDGDLAAVLGIHLLHLGKDLCAVKNLN